MAPPGPKRKAVSSPTPQEEGNEEVVAAVAKSSTKKTKRETMGERARGEAMAKEWAEQRRERKKQKAAEAALSSSSTAAVATTPNGNGNVKEPTLSVTSPKPASSSIQNRLPTAQERAEQWAKERAERKGAVPPGLTRPPSNLSSTSGNTGLPVPTSATKKPLSRPSAVHKDETSSAISSTATDAVRKSEEERPPMPTSTAASLLPIRMVAEYAVSTTSSTIITFDNNRVTISEPAVSSETREEDQQQGKPSSTLLSEPAIVESGTTTDSKDAHNSDRSEMKQEYTTLIAKKLCTVSRALVAFLTFSIRNLALAGAIGFCFYVWSFIYKDIATKMMQERSMALFPGASKLGRPSTSTKNYCYLNDRETQSLLVTHEMAPSASHGSECKTAGMLSKKPVHCPEHGVCRDGIWHSCAPSKLWGKDEGSRSCVLTNESQYTLTKVQQLLSQWTSNCMCGTQPNILGGSAKSNVCLHDGKDMEDGLKFFNVRDVAQQIIFMEATAVDFKLTEDEIEEKVEQLLALFPLSTKMPLVVHLQSQNDPSYMVALSKDSSSLVSLPFGCWLRIWLYFFMSVIFAIVNWTANQVAYFAMKHPMTFAIFFTTVFISHKIYGTYTRRAKARALASKARTICYDKLIYEAENGSNTYAVLHLGEDVAQTLYPYSLKKRQDFLNLIWPRVVIELKNDVRIQQCQKAVGGVALECWSWLGNKGSSVSTPSAVKKKSVGAITSDTLLQQDQLYEGE